VSPGHQFCAIVNYAYVFRLNATGTALNYSSTWAAPAHLTKASRSQWMPRAALYVAGPTNSTNFLLASGLVDTANVGVEAFIAKCNAAGAVGYSKWSVEGVDNRE
jgi:hypothetical protein